MSCEFCDVVEFDFGPLHRGQKRIVKLIIVAFCAFGLLGIAFGTVSPVGKRVRAIKVHSQNFGPRR